MVGVTAARQSGSYHFHVITSAAVIALLFVALVNQPFINAVKIWLGNEIYNHCLLVIPAAVFLIWERRKLFIELPFRTTWLAVPVIASQILLYTLGTAADIQLFQHIALFSLIPTLLWFFIGNAISSKLKFPLLFFVFAVPVGEELIPFLQEITADLSVILLKWSGIPIFRSGLFIQIPQGSFLIAEACSGVSFLIASVVLGSLYAYMFLQRMTYRLFFCALSLVFPIIANAFRVYGIIMIGYRSDMEHAVGADHLIYGWFFFAFVLVCLFVLGEVVKRYEKNRHGQKNTDVNVLRREADTEVESLSYTPSISAMGMVVVLFSLALLQDYRMQNVVVSNEVDSDIIIEFEKADVTSRVPWNPIFEGADKKVKHQYIDQNQISFSLFYALYAHGEGEVVSSLNRLYDQANWTLVSREPFVLDEFKVIKEFAASSIGTQKLLYYWYLVDREIVTTRREVKLRQAISKLKGKKSSTGIVAVAIDKESQIQSNNLSSLFEPSLLHVINSSSELFNPN